MNIVLNSLAVLLAAFGAYIVVLNFGAIVVNRRNKHRGIDRHVSMGYVLPQLCLLLAYVASCFATTRILPGWLLLAIGIADPSLWCLAALPIVLLLNR
jgi:ABC-type Fe3+ transport system permease subunit